LQRTRRGELIGFLSGTAQHLEHCYRSADVFLLVRPDGWSCEPWFGTKRSAEVSKSRGWGGHGTNCWSVATLSAQIENLSVCLSVDKHIALNLILLMWRIGWAPNSIPIYIQQDAVDTVVCAPDDGWKYHPKHAEQFPDINKLCNVASCWIYEYTGILLGARPILHISRIKVNISECA
jgi:hypothetical protein